jgi:hypothetical protein
LRPPTWLDATAQRGPRDEWHSAFRALRTSIRLFERLDDTKFNLLVIGQPAPRTHSLGIDELLHTHVVPLEGDNLRALAAVSITTPAYYLLRPDGHVGLVGTHADDRELKGWFSDSHLRVEAGQVASARASS